MKQRGFTLLEVMIALALLGFGTRRADQERGRQHLHAEEAHMMGVVTDLARGKMYDIEEMLLKDGFTDTEQSQDEREVLRRRGLAERLLHVQGRGAEAAELGPAAGDGAGQAEQAARARRAGSGLGRHRRLGLGLPPAVSRTARSAACSA